MEEGVPERDVDIRRVRRFPPTRLPRGDPRRAGGAGRGCRADRGAAHLLHGRLHHRALLRLARRQDREQGHLLHVGTSGHRAHHLCQQVYIEINKLLPNLTNS